MRPSIIESLRNIFTKKDVSAKPFELDKVEFYQPQAPTKEDLLAGKLIELVSASHLIDEHFEKTTSDGTEYLWAILSLPLSPEKIGKEAWIDDNLLDHSLHLAKDDPGIPFWNYWLTPEEDVLANQMLNDWNEKQTPSLDDSAGSEM
jgi:hypothetical protein